MQEIEFILYVADQEKSKAFYEHLLNLKPSLHVPGMTEFMLSENVKLGLMPEDGIANIIVPHLPHPKDGSGTPRCELYLKVKNVQSYINRGLSKDATLISEMKDRDWGDYVGYIADHDGHVIAFAEK